MTTSDWTALILYKNNIQLKQTENQNKVAYALILYKNNIQHMKIIDKTFDEIERMR